MVQIQVSSALPFPYTSVADFEAVLSQPLGPEWLPAQAHAAVTRAPVRTTAGRIIRPMHKATALAAAKKNKPLVKFS
jgi:U3 small nucleolar RNA-associated protein 14